MKNRIFTFALTLFCLFQARGQNMQLLPDNYMSNGIVSSITEDDDNIYLGGNFTFIGKSEPFGAAISTRSNTISYHFANPNAQVNVSLEDGQGGWFIAGAFLQVGGQAMQGFAHILSNGTLDPTWNLNPNNLISSLYISGGVLYVGGIFTTISGTSRSRFAAYDISTKSLLGFNPTFDGEVRSMLVVGDELILGGSFTNVNGTPRNRLASIDIPTSTLTAWNPDVNINVLTLAYDATNNELFIGGNFTTVGGLSRGRAASFSFPSKTLSSWDPMANAFVNKILVWNSKLILGGGFSSILGASQSFLVRFDLPAKTKDSWAPPINGTVNSIATNDTSLFVGGGFSKVNGLFRNFIASFDETGNLESWNPGTSNAVVSLSVSAGRVYAGGTFTLAGGEARTNIAAINKSTNTITAFNPIPSTGINSLHYSNGNLYAAGSFVSIGGQPRSRIGAVDVNTGLATSWNPNIAGATVNTITSRNGIVYVGGNFTTVGGVSRANLAAIDATTGIATSWNPSPNAPVLSIVVEDQIYVGGSFLTIAGQSKPRLAAFDVLSGSLNPIFSPAPNNSVTTLLFDNGILYAGGQFISINGQPRNGLASLHPYLGFVHPWNPNMIPGVVTCLGKTENHIVAGGNFASVGGLGRSKLAVIDKVTGIATSWNPAPGALVNCLLVTKNRIYAGGQFAVLGTATQERLAGFEGPAVSTGSISTSLCKEASVTIPYTASGIFTSGNVFTAQLSDEFGSFYTPTDIGSVTSTSSGSISATIPALTPTGTGYRIRVVSSQLAMYFEKNADDISIDECVSETFIWNGSQNDGDWNNAANWTPSGVPGSSSEVIISGTTSQPNLATNVSCARITLKGTAFPTIGSGFRLNVKRDFTATGNQVFGGNGTVVFNGTVMQTISGTVRLTNVEFANTSSAGVVIPALSTLKIEPGSVVTFLPDSKLTNDGEFILSSNATGTAKIGPVPVSATITGSFTQERYLTHGTGTGSWYLLGTPFGGNNFTNFSNDFRVVGLSGGFGDQGNDILPSVEPERSTILKYVESMHNVRTDTVQKSGWRIPSNENMVAGTGYRVWVNYYSNHRHLFDTKGTLTRGAGVNNEFTFPPLTRNEYSNCYPSAPGINPLNCSEANRGWNLIANPFPCDIDWDAAGGWTKPAELNNAFFTWNSAQGGYRAYVGAGGSSLGVTSNTESNPNLIPSGQSFFVRLTTPGTYVTNLSVKESAKVTTSSATFLRTATAAGNQLKIRLTSVNAPGYQFDAMVKMEEGSTDGFDQNRDLEIFPGTNAEFSIRSEGNAGRLLESIALITETRTIGLSMDYHGRTGVFSFGFPEGEMFLENTEVYLKDNHFGTLTLIQAGTEYSFAANSDGELNPIRFELILNPASVTGGKNLVSRMTRLLYPNPVTNQVFTLVCSGEDTELDITDILGRKVAFSMNQTVAGQKEVTFPSSVKAGQYWVKVRNSDGMTVHPVTVR
jgi:hypothetical protein